MRIETMAYSSCRPAEKYKRDEKKNGNDRSGTDINNMAAI